MLFFMSQRGLTLLSIQCSMYILKQEALYHNTDQKHTELNDNHNMLCYATLPRAQTTP